MHIHACACVCPPPRLLLISGMIWNPCGWLNKFYSLYMTAIVSIISRHGLWIEAHHRNQPSKSKLVLCIYHYCSCNSHLKQLCIHNKMENLSYEYGCGALGIHIWRHLKEELAWATIYVKSFRFCRWPFYYETFPPKLSIYKMCCWLWKDSLWKFPMNIPELSNLWNFSHSKLFTYMV